MEIKKAEHIRLMLMFRKIHWLVHLDEKNLKFYNFNFTESALAVKVYVPEKLYESLLIEAANGRIKAEEIGAKAATVKTINGTIELQDLQTSTLHVSSDNGKILLQNIEGDISGNVINGEIDFVTDHLQTAPLILRI